MNPSGLTVAVLMGGPSAEAEVSRVSAAEVAKAIDTAGHATTLIELDEHTTERLLQLNPDVVFPALHGPPGEDGTVQGFLEILRIPYVGSDVHGSALAMDKAIAKAVFRRARLPVAPDLVVDTTGELAAVVAQIRTELGEHVVLKPLGQGSAIGVTRVMGGMDLATEVGAAIAAHPQETQWLVEPFVEGRELTVGVIDLHDGEPTAFPVIEITTAAGQWYDYTNRYTPGNSQHIVPAALDPELSSALQRIAVQAHQALGLRDLSRADFLLGSDGAIVLLEVNTLPGMTPTSLYPDGARAMGMDFAALVDELIRSAHRRGA